MLTELEAVFILHYAVSSFVVVCVSALQLAKDLHLHVSVVDVELFVFADFGRNYLLLRVLEVDAFDDLAKSSSVNDAHHFVTPCKLLAWLDQVKAFSVGNCILILSADFANCVNFLVHGHLYLFKFCEFRAKDVDCFV